MTVFTWYQFDSSNSFDDPKDWNYLLSSGATPPPGSGDTAVLGGDAFHSVSLVCNGETVANLWGGQGIGQGYAIYDMITGPITVTGKIDDITLLGGDIATNDVGYVVVKGATLTAKVDTGDIVIDSGAATIKSWGGVGYVAISGGTFNAGTVNTGGHFTQTGGVAADAGAAALNSGAIWQISAGALSLTSGLTLHANTSFSVTGTGAITVHGAVTCTSTSGVAVGAFSGPSGGSLTVTGNYVGGAAGLLVGTSSVANIGGGFTGDAYVGTGGKLVVGGNLVDSNSNGLVQIVGGRASVGGSLVTKAGSLLVGGAKAVVTVGQGIYVGESATANFSVNAGDRVKAGRLYVGVDAKGVGSVNINGAGASLSIIGVGVSVGTAGSGTLDLTGGALTLAANGAFGIASDAKSSGTVVISGATSAFKLNGDEMRVGDAGAGAFWLTEGAHVSAGRIDVAEVAGSSGNIYVYGSGPGRNSELDATSLNVGGGAAAGGTGAVTVFNGKMLVSGATHIWAGGSITLKAQTLDPLSGVILDGVVVNQGVINTAENLGIYSAISGAGTINLQGLGFAYFKSSVGAGQKIVFSAAGEGVRLDAPRSVRAVFSHFSVGDTIDLASIAYNTGSRVKIVGDAIIVTPTTGAAIQLTLDPATIPLAVALAKDSAGDTKIIVTKAAAALAAPNAASTMPLASAEHAAARRDCSMMFAAGVMPLNSIEPVEAAGAGGRHSSGAPGSSAPGGLTGADLADAIAGLSSAAPGATWDPASLHLALADRPIPGGPTLALSLIPHCFGAPS